MFRFFKQAAQRIIVALVYLTKAEEAAGNDGRAAIIAVMRQFRSENPVHTDTVRRAIDAYQTTDPYGDEDIQTTPEILNTAISQVTRKKSDDVDLIDTIVRALQLPYAANNWNTAYLRGLRDAILRPDEIIKWRKANTNFHCAGDCGGDFVAGELCTAMDAGDGSYKFFCNKCQPPSYAACKHCGNEVVITSDFRVRKGADCGCKREKPTPPAEPGVAVATVGPQTIAGYAEAQRIALNAAQRRAAAREPLQRQFYVGGQAQPTVAPPLDLDARDNPYPGMMAYTFIENLANEVPEDGPAE